MFLGLILTIAVYAGGQDRAVDPRTLPPPLRGPVIAVPARKMDIFRLQQCLAYELDKPGYDVIQGGYQVAHVLRRGARRYTASITYLPRTDETSKARYDVRTSREGDADRVLERMRFCIAIED